MQLVSTTLTAVEPKLRRWTRAEYYQMGDMGWFEGQRVQLIEGDIVMMSPQKFSHYATIARIEKILNQTLGSGVWVRTQAPLSLSPQSEPEPDISVVEGTLDDYTDHPTTALLVVEVSNTTLQFDRETKASLYASAGIAEYWIANLVDRQLEVYRNPVSDSEQPSASHYTERTILNRTDSAVPLLEPHPKIPVAKLFG